MATLSKKARRALANDHLDREFFWELLVQAIMDRGLSRAESAQVVKDAASQLSRLMTGHAHEFSADRMVGMLLNLGDDITVVVERKKHLRRGRIKYLVRDGRKVRPFRLKVKKAKK